MLPLPAATVEVLGAGCDVGRSCMLLTLPPHRLLLDCGAHPLLGDEHRFPPLASVPALHSLTAVLISHFHLDHAAALPLLTETLACRAPVYMTAPTRALAALMLADFVATSAARRHHCPFSAADARASLARVHLLHPGVRVLVGEGESAGGEVAVTAYYAGHVLGAVMLHVEAGGRSVLYSGDYSTAAGRHLRAASVPFGLRPDLFITEATYCSTVRREGRAAQEQVVMRAVMEAVERGGKVLVPVSAFGRVHAMCALFAAHVEGEALTRVPMYVVSGLASKANRVYEGFAEWTAEVGREGCGWSAGWSCGGEEEVQVKGRKGYAFVSRLKQFNRNEHWGLLRGKGPMILFATPGTMSTGLSKDVFELWAKDAKNLVIVPGTNFANIVSAKCDAGVGAGGSGSNARVRCKMVPMTFGSHADARGLVRTCRKVDAGAVMLVHGEKTKIMAFKPLLMQALKRPCFAPINGETVVISDRPKSTAEDEVDIVKAMPQGRQLPPEWESLIETYTRAMKSQERERSAF